MGGIWTTVGQIFKEWFLKGDGMTYTPSKPTGPRIDPRAAGRTSETVSHITRPEPSKSTSEVKDLF